MQPFQVLAPFAQIVAALKTAGFLVDYIILLVCA
jgi:hypothetical protein